MSIQVHRETIASNTGALMAADGNFFSAVATRFETMRAKGNAHPADLRRLRGDVANWTHRLVAKPNWNAANDQPVYDGATAWIALCDAEIDLSVIAHDHGGRRRSPANDWINADTGQPVRVFAKHEKLADHGHRSGDAGVGDILAGLIAGPKTPEIKAALSEGTDSAGGYSIPTEVLSEFFDRLRAKTQFIQAGARTLMLDGLRTRIMRTASDPAAAWRAENAAVSESAPTFEAVDFAPKSLAVLVKVSMELLQDSVNVSDALEAALIGSLSVELDRACLFGSGSSNEPTGLFNLSGINSVSMGTNGATPSSYDELLDAIYENELDNAAPATAAILHPRTAKTLRKLKDTTNQPLLLPPSLQDLPMLASTSVPITQTQGTATSVCSTTLVGDFTQAILGLRQELRITRLDQTYAGNLQVGFIAHLRADVGFAHPESFCKIIGIKA